MYARRKAPTRGSGCCTVAACGSDGGGDDGAGEEESHRRPDHEARHEPVLREDEGSCAGGGEGEQRPVADRGGQDRHGQPETGHSDGEHDHARREGHPHHPRGLRGDRPGGPEVTSRGGHRHRAGHADGAAERRGRPFRDGQQEGRLHRRVGQAEARHGEEDAQDRDARPRAGHLGGAAATTASWRASGSTTAIRRSSALSTRRATPPRVRPAWSSCSRRIRGPTSCTQSTSRPASAPPRRSGERARTRRSCPWTRLRGHPQRHQEGRDRRDVAAVPAEHGEARRRGGRQAARGRVSCRGTRTPA